MKYKQSSTANRFATPTTKTIDGGIREDDRAVKIAGASEAMQYRRRLKNILDEMINTNPILQKIHKGESIAENDLKTLSSTILTTHPGVNLDVLNQFYGRTAKDLQVTIREIIGLNAKAVEEHFKQFLHQHPTLTAQQVQFMNLLKNYIAQYGSIKVDTLYEAPFTSISHEGIDGVFSTDDADELFAVLKPYIQKDKPTNQPHSY